MGFRNIKIDSHVKLSIKNQQLNIETDIARQIPLEDINCIIIENQTVTVSAYLLQKMADMGIAVYVCDEKHLPNAVLLPMVRHSRHFKILKYQIEAGKPLQKRLWQQIDLYLSGSSDVVCTCGTYCGKGIYSPECSCGRKQSLFCRPDQKYGAGR